MSTGLFHDIVLLLIGDMLYIPQYWWHIVRSSGSPNIAVNIWIEQFNFEDKFHKAGLSEDTDVSKVPYVIQLLYNNENINPVTFMPAKSVHEQPLSMQRL